MPQRVASRIAAHVTLAGGLLLGVSLGVLMGRRSAPVLTIPETALALRGSLSATQVSIELASIADASPNDRTALALRLLEWRRAGADSVTRRAAALAWTSAERTADSLGQTRGAPFSSSIVRAAYRDALYTGVSLADLEQARGHDAYALAQDIDRRAAQRRRTMMMNLRRAAPITFPDSAP
jgi:hypothetical protein